MTVRSRAALVMVVAALATTAAGCQLMSGAGINFDPGTVGIPEGNTGTGDGSVAGATSAPGEPNPTLPNEPNAGAGPAAIAAYSSGHAVVVLGDGTRIELDRINRGPHVYQQFGSMIRFSNAFGWYLTVSGAGAEADMGAPYVILDHVVGGQHLTIDNPTACTVGIDMSNAQQLRGSATCRSLHWADAIDMGIDGAHRDAGLPAFSAQITFEAGS